VESEFPQFLMAIGVFAGAVVSGFTGFAFSAVAGAVLLHMLPPSEAVPLMMVCSVLVQGINLVSLRAHVRWRESAALIAGGLLGLPPALYVLLHAEPALFRLGFGAFLAVYAGYMLLRPLLFRTRRPEAARAPGLAQQAAIGLAGGLVGGVTAMPGAIPTIWCDLGGMGKERQRGMVQPYITAMQIAALAFLLARRSLPEALFDDVVLCVPPLAAGTLLGLALFGRVSDALFRRVLLGVLLVSGLTYVI
jgi:uncharacterized membrane protein YfcA